MFLYTVANAKLSEDWEEAARLTTLKLFGYIRENERIFEDLHTVLFHNRVLTNNHIENMRIVVDYMVDNKVWVHDDTDDYEILAILAQYWAALSLFSALYSKVNDVDFDLYLYENFITKTVIAKQKDYGPENIARFGLNGLIIRMHDKVARLENLFSKGLKPTNESIKDNLLDVIGYSVVAIMWINKTFLLPMSNENSFTPKNLSNNDIWKSVHESPIPRHKYVTSSGSSQINTSYSVFDSRGNNINNGSYTYPNPNHPNPKFR